MHGSEEIEHYSHAGGPRTDPWKICRTAVSCKTCPDPPGRRRLRDARIPLDINKRLLHHEILEPNDGARTWKEKDLEQVIDTNGNISNLRLKRVGGASKADAAKPEVTLLRRWQHVRKVDTTKPFFISAHFLFLWLPVVQQFRRADKGGRCQSLREGELKIIRWKDTRWDKCNTVKRNKYGGSWGQ